MKGLRTRLLPTLLLAAAAWAAYSNSFRAPFVLDDADAITENPTLHSLWRSLVPPGGGATVSGRPLLNLSLAVNYAVSGERVWSYHAANLLIHILAACVLFALVRRTLELPALRERFAGAQVALAAAIAGVWMLHPLQTEAVTYTCQRAESLMGLFVLLTLYGFVRAVTSPRPWPWRAATVLACLAGVATKEVAVLAPPLVLLYDRTFVAGSLREAWRRRPWLHASLFGTWAPLAWLVAGGGWNRGGTAGFGVGVSPWAYWLTQFVAIVHYVKLAVWPHPLVFEYGPFWVGVRQAAPYAALVAALAAATLWALLRRPALGYLGAWFFAILAPTSIVPGTNQMIVEHRLYLPLAALVALAVTGMYALGGRRSLALWPALAAVLGGLTFLRNRTYRSELALWRDTVAKAPGNPRAHYNLGIVYSGEQRYAEAVVEDQAALRLADGPIDAARRPSVENKLGLDLADSGRLTDAVAAYEQALQWAPDYGFAHLNLARAFVRLGRYPDAVRQYEAALQRNVGGAPAEAELGDALMHEGRLADVIAHYEAAVRLAPKWAAGFNNLGFALLQAGRFGDAIAAYRRAARIDPAYAAAWMGLGYALMQGGRPADAIAPCSQAVRLGPGSADAHNLLGMAMAETGRTGGAIAEFEDALRLNPNAADVHNNLGNALDAAGRVREATAQYREALRLDPSYAPARRNLLAELRRARSEPQP